MYLNKQFLFTSKLSKCILKKSLFCLFLLPRVKTSDIVMLLEYKRKQT